MTAIGCVCHGAMGGRIADRLPGATNVVYATNRTRGDAARLVGRGLIWRDSPRAVVEPAEVAFVRAQTARTREVAVA